MHSCKHYPTYSCKHYPTYSCKTKYPLFKYDLLLGWGWSDSCQEGGLLTLGGVWVCPCRQGRPVGKCLQLGWPDKSRRRQRLLLWHAVKSQTSETVLLYWYPRYILISAFKQIFLSMIPFHICPHFTNAKSLLIQSTHLSLRLFPPVRVHLFSSLLTPPVHSTSSAHLNCHVSANILPREILHTNPQPQSLLASFVSFSQPAVL